MEEIYNLSPRTSLDKITSNNPKQNYSSINYFEADLMSYKNKNNQVIKTKDILNKNVKNMNKNKKS